MKAFIKVDPRVKLALFLVTCVYVMNCTQVLFCMMLGGFIVLLLVLSGELLTGIRGLILYSVTVFGLAYVKRYLSGNFSVFVFSILAISRIMIPIFLSFKLVVKTTTISEFMSAFQKMRIPSKIIIPFAVMFRFVPTVNETWSHIRGAMAFRGLSLSLFGFIRRPGKTLEYILVPLLFSASSVIEELAAASLARGLDSDHPRTSLLEVKMSLLDYLFMLMVLFFFVTMFFC